MWPKPIQGANSSSVAWLKVQNFCRWECAGMWDFHLLGWTGSSGGSQMDDQCFRECYVIWAWILRWLAGDESDTLPRWANQRWSLESLSGTLSAVAMLVSGVAVGAQMMRCCHVSVAPPIHSAPSLRSSAVYDLGPGTQPVGKPLTFRTTWFSNRVDHVIQQVTFWMTTGGFW